MPIGILLNPRAGKNKSGKILRSIITLLNAKAIPYQAFTNEWPIDYSKFSAVWLIGGDGTLNYFINHFPQANLPLALFKGGTGNDFATHLYGAASTEEMVNIILNASPRPVDAGICNGQLFVNTVGIGFDGQVLKNMNTIRWMGSFLGYYTAIIKNIFSFIEPEYTIHVDHQPTICGRLLLVLLSNAPATGGGFVVSPMADSCDGKLNLITCQPLSRLKRLFALPSIRKGSHLQLPFIHHQAVQSVTVETAVTVAAQIDGELIFGRRFDCNILPGRYQFLF
ncbi:diacylglycerol/lipid kinase family protein [Flavihumibacter profundi]|uniref:diacylglycerol/lipid kinase family protein n=1 Tax=Flavihumibacter profundi TaxID=2716883 RepID=UPI001CC3CD9A|nr:diacylglycerol kinase family protein [Flavihumibacter profundi]MBZ5857284.1 hypothetical protein [Flavihumibacter profundi]